MRSEAMSAVIRCRTWLVALAAVLVVAVAVAAARAPTGASPEGQLVIGLNGDVNDDLPIRLGVRQMRQSLAWGPVQPRPGVWRWKTTDFRVEAAARRRLSLLPVLLGGASWAGGWNGLPADPRAYANWVRRVIERYGPGGGFWEANPQLPYMPVRYIELWNEPYLDFFSRGGVDAGRYARLVRAAVQAGRRANPEVRYILQADWTPGEPRRSFIDDMYSAVPDLNRWFDVIALHPYSSDRPPAPMGDPWGFSRISDARARFVANGAARKPIWITEVGWSTCPVGARRQCVREDEQARHMRRVHELVVDYHPYVRALYFYNGRDARRGTRDDREDWFGIVRGDGSRKPAFRAFQAILESELHRE